MLWIKIILTIGVVTICGVVIESIIVTSCNGPLRDTQGFEFVNPVWWYRNYRVNHFGAAMCALGFTLLCPVGTAGYWFYKLCTVGRR